MKIAIVTNKPYKTCETFVKAQIDLLPFNSVHISVNDLPVFLTDSGNKPVQRLKNKIVRLTKHPHVIAFEQKLKKANVDLVLAHYGTTGAVIASVCQKLKLPLIVHFHGYDVFRRNVLNAYETQYAQMFGSAKKLISVSIEMTKRLCAMGCPPEKIVCNPCGPSDIFMDIDPTFAKTQFVGVGRFVEKKSPHITIESFKLVTEQYPEANLVMAGDGPLLEHCKALVHKYGLSDKVIFPGNVSSDVIVNYFSESLAFVQHSVEASDGDMEGTPVSILEASVAGLPIISTKHAGIPDVVIHQETGLLCDEKDINGMAEIMIWVLKNKEEAIDMGRAGKERIRNNFSMSHHIADLTNVINTVVLTAQ